ncbi:MAG: anion permease [Lachnospiraceae bacterium]|nr:anion permease [Lachnospiraceae bacterium]
MKKIITFIKNETVLSIAAALAVVSILFIPLDRQYPDYIDFRTLGLLFSLMTISAGIRRTGFFTVLAGRLAAGSRSAAGMVTALVLVSFFLSMLITNDVSLITLVPLTILCFRKFTPNTRRAWLIPAVVLETVAANLGSMATPVGNPQNLYLYGISDMPLGAFFKLILPYSLLSLLLLLIWIRLHDRRINRQGQAAGLNLKSPDAFEAGQSAPAEITSRHKIAAYLILFVLCLFTVARLLPWPVPFAAVLLYALAADRETLAEVDYALLGTFLALFIFIGNLGRIPAFRETLLNILKGHEVFTAIGASQFMSNVPAAILLSGFTDRIDALIIGTNLGGLGTLIASMASLISYKIIIKEEEVSSGRYLNYFTLTNLAFLAALALLHILIR